MNLERIDGGVAPRIATGARTEAGAGAKAACGTQGAAPAFEEVLHEALDEANRLQSSANSAIQGLAAGDEKDVAEVMTAVEKADLAFRTLMQVRNKLVDAYEELMRLRI